VEILYPHAATAKAILKRAHKTTFLTKSFRVRYDI